MSRRTIDIAFSTARLAIFLDGCFWHGCPEHGSIPATNEGWWRDKLHGNRMRDCETTSHLAQLGWTVLRFWEHEEVSTMVPKVTSALSALSDRKSFAAASERC